MNSRERFKRAINHQEPDRVPIDVGGDFHNGLHEVAYGKLLQLLEEQDEIKIYDYMQHLAVVKESVLRRLHGDTRYVFASAAEGYQRVVAPDTSWFDEWGVQRKTVGFYDESVGTPLADCTYEKIKNYRLPDPGDKNRFKGLNERAKRLYEDTEYAVIGGNAASLFFLTSEIIGYQEYMEKILTETKMIETLIDRVLEWQMDFFGCYLDEIGEYTEMIWMGDDWGTQRSPLMSPALFREIFIPRYKQFTQFIKKRADVKIALHSCGSIYWALGDLADAGIDVLHPLQGDAVGFEDPYKLKKEYGSDLVLYSNLRNQSVIPHGTVEEVIEEVKFKIGALAPGGGYIMSGGHNIQADVPPENILAMIDTTIKYGNYPIKTV